MAARIGAAIVNTGAGGGTTAGRHHHARNTPAAAPPIANAVLPINVFSRFHCQRGPPLARPASVAIPSPIARIPMPRDDIGVAGRRRAAQEHGERVA
jgi:hypothetical protein